MANGLWKLSPSDFAFLWDECKCCFYLKVAENFPRPQSAMPKIFITIDLAMKLALTDQRTELIAPGIPTGVIHSGERWVESEPISRPGRTAACYVRGKFDTIMRFDDGSYGVVDFKTSQVKGSHVARYARQLRAYAYALEHPAPGKLALGPISRLGLLVFDPVAFDNRNDGSAALTGSLTWLEIRHDEDAFLTFIDDVLDVLERGTPPEPSPDCVWCRYREASRRTEF